MRPVAIASNTGKRPPRSRPWTSAVMKTVLPALASPVTPSLIVGSNKWLLKSARAAAASRIRSMSSPTIAASVCCPQSRAGRDDPYSENDHRPNFSKSAGWSNRHNESGGRVSELIAATSREWPVMFDNAQFAHGQLIDLKRTETGLLDGKAANRKTADRQCPNRNRAERHRAQRQRQQAGCGNGLGLSDYLARHVRPPSGRPDFREQAGSDYRLTATLPSRAAVY